MNITTNNLLPAVLFVLSSLGMASPADAQTGDEYSLKAALNYNFARYTQWPEPAGQQFVEFCFFNEDYSTSFAPLMNRTIAEKKIQVRFLNNETNIDSCHLIFIDSDNRRLVKSLLMNLESKPILTVSDSNGFSSEGGMIEILTINNKLRFKINLRSLQQSGITLGSQVLNLATEIVR